MKCINCESEWQPSGKASISVTKCPFCGENPQEKKAEPTSYDNSKDALAAIIKQFGADKLLGKLNAIFPDFAPSVDNKIKKLVYTVYDSGASKVLKENLNGSQEDKERAVKIAIRNMTENFIVSEIAENIIYDFIDALGWKIKREIIKPETSVLPLPAKTKKKSSFKPKTDTAYRRILQKQSSGIEMRHNMGIKTHSYNSIILKDSVRFSIKSIGK